MNNKQTYSSVVKSQSPINLSRYKILYQGKSGDELVAIINNITTAILKSSGYEAVFAEFRKLPKQDMEDLIDMKFKEILNG